MDRETLMARITPGMGEPDAATQMYGDTGVSVRTLNAYVDSILPMITDDAQVTDAFVQQHIGFLKSMGGQMRHERSEFIKNYKPAPPIPPKDESKEELIELQKEFEDLKKQLAGNKKEHDLMALRAEVKEKAEDLKVHNKALWNDVVNNTIMSEGMDSVAFENVVKKSYEAKLKAYFGDGAEPYGGTKGNAGNVDDESAKSKREAFKERMRKRGKLPNKEA